MGEIRFRNHLSVVFEKLIGFIVVLVILLLQNMDDLVDMVRALRMEGVAVLDTKALVVMGVLLLVLAIVLGINVLVWSKTWITITPSTIILERNTLNKVRNTIGMKNISNVNLEQSFWEKILGTCKLKMDTNSLSTADSTDIAIVLKQAKAREIQAVILERVNEAQGWNEAAAANGSVGMYGSAGMHGSEADCQPYDVFASKKEIALHGLCSVNLWVLLLLIGVVSGAISFIDRSQDSFDGGWVAILVNLVMLAGVVISCLKSLLGGFITYHGFKVGRRGDKILVHYGLFRTFDYTIPVSKINAVKVKQTLIGRVLKKYMVELVNVGMGDESEEAGAYIILACDRGNLQKHLEQLLPEYAEIPLDRIQRQPRTVIWNKVVKTLIWSSVIVVVAGICYRSIPFLKLWWVAGSAGFLIVYGILLAVLDYYTAGVDWDEHLLLVANGCFRRDVTVMNYDKVQYLEISTNLILKHFGLVYGKANLLAAVKEQTQVIPVCVAAEVEPYIQKYVYWKRNR